jgi:hypothetical protein
MILPTFLSLLGADQILAKSLGAKSFFQCLETFRVFGVFRGSLSKVWNPAAGGVNFCSSLFHPPPLGYGATRWLERSRGFCRLIENLIKDPPWH